MTLTPEQIAQGWRLHDGSDVCPIKDDETRIEMMWSGGDEFTSHNAGSYRWKHWHGRDSLIAYRIIEAHGADAEPDRPTPFPASIDDLVYDGDGMSQPFITGGDWPEWLPDDAMWQGEKGGPIWDGKRLFDAELAIRVRRREPKRETVQCIIHHRASEPLFGLIATIDLIDGKPDLSTLKIAEGSA